MVGAFERIRAVWNPQEPLALHHEVELLAFEGFTKSEIESALTELLLEIRAAGADDDTEELVNGVSDRITGWCAPECHIHTREGAFRNGHAHPPLPVVAPR